MYDHMKWLSLQSPASNKYRPNYALIDEKNPAATFAGKPRDKFILRKPTIFITPGVGSYEIGKSFKIAVEKRLAKMAIFPSEKGGTFINRIIREKKKIPAVGSYKKVETGIDKISRPLSAMRKRI